MEHKVTYAELKALEIKLRGEPGEPPRSMNGTQMIDFFNRLRGRTLQHVDRVRLEAPKSWLAFFRDVFLQKKRKKKKEEYKKKLLDLKKKAFAEDFHCSTPLYPIPIENCLTMCNIEPINPMEIGTEENNIDRRIFTQRNVFTNGDDSSTFLHNWEKILKEIGTHRFPNNPYEARHGSEDYDSLED